ncbi:UNVERIFIED_CONTAM: hypothetical protein RMT77_001372 [Armadillidium vulgare]
MLLIIGASEVTKFDQIRSYIQEELGEEMTTDSYPGRWLGSCIRVIQELMTPETKIVLLWALTPLAWRSEYRGGWMMIYCVHSEQEYLTR